MTKTLDWLTSIVWGAPALILILGVGFYLTIKLRFVQFALLPRAFRHFLGKDSQNDDGISSFQALCTALAATVGTGNLAGVAGAICLGGPGAIFWMWICGFLGMVTKYAEAALAVRYCEQKNGTAHGGPMYVMIHGLGPRFRPMAAIYCFCGVIAAFGVGTGTQINAVITGIHGIQEQLGMDSTKSADYLLGVILGISTVFLMLGGAQTVAKAAQTLVPIAACGYIAMCLGVLVIYRERIPEAFSMILEGAVSPRAVTGGMLGSAFQALRIGCSRGVFTNEAGMGTAGIAHGSAHVQHPAQQGLMGIMEVFVDTIVICTATALVILVSGVSVPYGQDVGGELTLRAFGSIYGSHAVILLTLAMLLFASATILGWGMYGARCAEFLFGPQAWKWFALAQGVAAALSAVADTAVIWQLSELMNGLMAIPNLITLAVLTPELCRITIDYKKTGKTAGGGTYADFHQCKPL